MINVNQKQVINVVIIVSFFFIFIGYNASNFAAFIKKQKKKDLIQVKTGYVNYIVWVQQHAFLGQYRTVTRVLKDDSFKRLCTLIHIFSNFCFSFSFIYKRQYLHSWDDKDIVPVISSRWFVVSKEKRTMWSVISKRATFDRVIIMRSELCMQRFVAICCVQQTSALHC